jgi:hypothetical protein
MLRFKFGIAVIVLAAALSTSAYAAKGSGGAGHAGGGGGHAGSGGGHAGGGGGSGRASGGGGRHVSGGGGGGRISARPAISRSSASPSSRGTVSRGTASRSGSVATSTPATNAVGQRTLYNSTGNPTRDAHLNPNLRSSAVRSTLNSPAVAGALRNRSALRNPNSRSHITASAATAGWHNGRDGGNGWWRHGNGG